MNSVTNSVAAKQVISGITNEFLDSNPKWWEPNKPTVSFFCFVLSLRSEKSIGDFSII
jgi:hypothetical protein